MLTKHLCVLIHTRTKGEVRYHETSLRIVTDLSKVVHLLWIIFVINVSCLSCFINCSLQACGHLLGKGRLISSPVC